MTTEISPRYQPTFRQTEIKVICDCARQGQSLCLLGVAGTGKSNITNFLSVDPYGYKAHYLGDQSTRFHFPVVDGNTWDETPQGLWKLMLVALNEATRHLAQPEPDAKLIQFSEEQKAFSDLKTHVDWFCQKLDQQVMFILDDFDKILEVGPLAMLEQLNALRSSGNRNKLGYLLFTKRLPHILGRAHPLKGTAKFYDLISTHIYALGLYNHDDARQMLVHLNELAGKALTTRELAVIESLAGGHARLLRLTFELWRGDAPETADFVSFFAAKTDIHDECQRILRGLHQDEQAVALRVARDQQTANDQDVIDHLMRRGLLINSGKLEWFSPVFATFLRSYNA